MLGISVSQKEKAAPKDGLWWLGYFAVGCALGAVGLAALVIAAAVSGGPI
jgi:hypothetical protein